MVTFIACLTQPAVNWALSPTLLADSERKHFSVSLVGSPAYQPSSGCYATGTPLGKNAWRTPRHLHLAHTAPVGRCRGVQVSGSARRARGDASQTHTVRQPVLQITVVSFHKFWESLRGRSHQGTVFGSHSSFFVGKVPGWLSKATKLGLIAIRRRIRMIIELLILGIYPLLSLVALFALRQSHLTGIPRVLWAFLIVVVPLLGALAFFILNPSENTSS